jgi:hypothetical protein
MTVGQLKDKYREVFEEESRSNHKQFLFRRIAWRIQANVEGGLSERARRRALEIANDADLRIRAPKNFLKEALDDRPAASPTGHALGSPFPGEGHRRPGPRGRFRVRWQAVPLFECRRTRGNRHPMERLRVLRVGR